MKTKFKYLILIVLVLSAASQAKAQYSTADNPGEFVEYVIMENKDTSVVYRHPGDWWFGVIGGGNFNLGFSDLKIPRRPQDPIDLNNILINYSTGTGGGFFLGLMGEWKKPSEKWGVTCNLYVFDKRSNNSESDEIKMPEYDSTLSGYDMYYEALASYTYISLSPAIKYKLPIAGLHLYGGLDLDILLSSDMKNRLNFKNKSDINQDHEIVKVSPQSVRVGMHLGVGYEFYVADISHKVRLNFVPYLSFHGGTSVFEGYGSSRNALNIRAGLMVKFGPDIVKEEMRLFDPTYIQPPEYLASTDFHRPVNFPGIQREELVAENLSWVPYRESDTVEGRETSVAQGDSVIRRTQIDTTELIARVDTMTRVDNRVDTMKAVVKDTGSVIAEIPDRTTIPPDETKLKFNPNKVQKLYFKDRLSKNDKAMLDEIAKYLIANPGATLRIVGHAATDGDFTQNEASSKARASSVVNYLLSKNINRRRLLDTYEGSRRAEAPNDNEAGRRKNRRVEIRVIM